MKFITERRKEIEARKAELRAEIEKPDTKEERLAEIKAEAEALNTELEELRVKEALEMTKRNLEPVEPSKRTAEPTSAEILMRDGRTTIKMFSEGRSLLVSSGTLVTPTGTATEIGGLPDLTGSILEDVDSIDATGTAAWEFPYEKTGAKAGAATEGQAVESTSATFDKITIGPEEWSTFDEVSKQVKKMTPVAYEHAVKTTAVVALREEAEVRLTNNIVKSTIIEKKENVKLDADYLRNLKLGYKNPKGVTGPAKLYINQVDLMKLGKIRGTNEKKALYSFEYDAENENTGIISEGGVSIRFSINDNLPEGQQLYGNPKTVKMLMWGDYEVTTDEGGDFFKRRMIGISGDQTAGADLAVYHGMQLINQATFMA